MEPVHPNHTIVNIVYYTQPLCPVSWQMQQHWHEFTTKFSELINIRLCMDVYDAKSRGQDGPGPAPSNIKACQAVKAVSFQSQRAADLYLAALRKAAFVDGKDISLNSVLVDLAREISRANHGVLDLQRFGTDFNSPVTRRALQKDALKIHANRIESCPTITFTVNGFGVKGTGLLSFHQLAAMLKKVMTPMSATAPAPIPEKSFRSSARSPQNRRGC